MSSPSSSATTTARAVMSAAAVVVLRTAVAVRSSSSARLACARPPPGRAGMIMTPRCPFSVAFVGTSPRACGGGGRWTSGFAAAAGPRARPPPSWCVRRHFDGGATIAATTPFCFSSSSSRSIPQGLRRYRCGRWSSMSRDCRRGCYTSGDGDGDDLADADRASTDPGMAGGSLRMPGGGGDDGGSIDGDDVGTGTGISADTRRNLRVRLLHERLAALDVCDPEELAGAAERSILDPTGGYDVRFGRSAIRAYRTYVRGPKTRKGIGGGMMDEEEEDPRVAAQRTARQIDFLIRRHRSREAEWVRNTDDPDDLIPLRDVDEGGAYRPSSRRRRRTFPLVLVLDNLRSAFNVGSIFRTADAAGCAAVLTTGITPHPDGSGADKLAKSALGAERLVPTRHFDTTMEAVRFLRDLDGGEGEGEGVLLVAMETTDRSRRYADVDFPRPSSHPAVDGEDDHNDHLLRRDLDGGGVALLLGNEVTGVDTEILPHMDEIVEIPMFGAKNSLNVAAAAPVVIYEVLRQWGAMEEKEERGGE